MITKDRLIILQSGTTLTGALCRIGLKRRDVLLLHRVVCAERTSEAVAAGLDSLLEALHRDASSLEVRLCLSAENVLFRDWAFPFRSRAKVEQALGLLLETEFPFDAAVLAHRICLMGNAAPAAGFKNGVQALSVSFRREDLDFWLETLAARNLCPELVTVDPFPLLSSLPPRQSGLLLHVQNDHSLLALLDNGVVRRLRTLPAGWDATRESESVLSLHREANLVLEGVGAPERLYLYGEPFLHGSAATGLADAFGLPVSLLGQDLPLAGQMGRLGETDPARLMALCVAAMPSPNRWRPFPSFHRAPQRRLSGHYGKLLGVGCGLLCVGAACLASIWAEGYADRQQTLRHETAARDLFRKALPDIRGSFNAMQMESILKNRISALRGSDDDTAFPVLHLLQAMHAAVPPSLNVRFDRLSLDARRCGLSGTAAGYEQVNALRTALSRLPGVREAKILSAANRTGKPEPGRPAGEVLFEIELALEGDQS